MTTTVGFTNTFLKEHKRLPPDRQKAITSAISRFMEDPSRAGLDFRPLAGKRDHFIIDGAHGDRVILRRESATVFTAVDVGPHNSIYRRMKRR